MDGVVDDLRHLIFRALGQLPRRYRIKGDPDGRKRQQNDDQKSDQQLDAQPKLHHAHHSMPKDDRVFRRRHADEIFERLRKMGIILVTDLNRDVRDGQRRDGQQLARFLDPFFDAVMHEGFAGHLFEQCAEIGPRQAHPLGDLLQRHLFRKMQVDERLRFLDRILEFAFARQLQLGIHLLKHRPECCERFLFADVRAADVQADLRLPSPLGELSRDHAQAVLQHGFHAGHMQPRKQSLPLPFFEQLGPCRFFAASRCFAPAFPTIPRIFAGERCFRSCRR